MKFTYQNLLSLSVAGLLAFFAVGKGVESQKNSSPTKPNILVIIPDDLGWSWGTTGRW